MYALANLTKSLNATAPGMSDEIFVCLRKEILVFPPVITYAAAGDTLRISADITFDVADGWVSVYATKDSVQQMVKKVGQNDSRGFNAEIQFHFPGYDAAFMEALVADEDFLVALKKPDCTGSEYYLFGTKCRALKMMGDFDSALADDESGKHGFAAMFQGYIPKPFFYTGEITLKP